MTSVSRCPLYLLVKPAPWQAAELRASEAESELEVARATCTVSAADHDRLVAQLQDAASKLENAEAEAAEQAYTLEQKDDELAELREQLKAARTSAQAVDQSASDMRQYIAEKEEQLQVCVFVAESGNVSLYTLQLSLTLVFLSYQRPGG